MTVNAMKKDLAEYCAYIENHHEEFMLNIELSTHKVYKSPLTFLEKFGYDIDIEINGVKLTTEENDFKNK